ncbi:MAG TPA: hypothetical protein PLJ21_06490 [Pseudobdellovibrionaceae bacterium]|mgnify:CR=1 FL=1|nr:hypothetical protein [Pseudobdellovibrionaceae bacterium]
MKTNIFKLIMLSLFFVFLGNSAQAAVSDWIVNDYEGTPCVRTLKNGEQETAFRFTALKVFVDDRGKNLSASKRQKIEDGVPYCSSFALVGRAMQKDISRQPVSYQKVFTDDFLDCYFKFIGGYWVEVWTDYESTCEWE